MSKVYMVGQGGFVSFRMLDYMSSASYWDGHYANDAYPTALYSSKRSPLMGASK